MNPTPSQQPADAAVVPLAAGYPHTVAESPSPAEPPREDFVELRVTRAGAPTRRLQVHAPRCTFGSGEGCTVRLSDPALRSLHAVLLRDAAGVRICADAIAIEVNDQPAMQAPLERGDTFRLGPFCFELLSAPQPVPPQAAAAPPAGRFPALGSESEVDIGAATSGENGTTREAKPAPATLREIDRRALPPAAQREFEQTIETLQHQLAALREELQSVRAAAKSQLRDSLHQGEATRQQLDQLQRRCAELQDQLQTALQQRDAAARERDEAVRERDEAVRQHADLRAGRDKALAQRSEAIDIEQAAQAQLRQVNQRLAHLQQQLDQAQQQAQGEQQQLQEVAEQQRSEAERLREEVAQQRKEVQQQRSEAERLRGEAEHQRQEAEQQRGQLERLREEAGELREEVEQLRQQAAQWQSENQRLRELLQSERQSLEAHMSRLLQQAGRRSPAESSLSAAAIRQDGGGEPVAAAPVSPKESVPAKEPAVARQAASPCPAPASPERAAPTSADADQPAPRSQPATHPVPSVTRPRPSAGEPGQAAAAQPRPVVRRPPATSGFLSGPLQAAMVLLCGGVFFYCAQQNAALRIVWTTAGTLACVLALFCLYDWRRNSWMRRTSALANSASGPR